MLLIMTLLSLSLPWLLKSYTQKLPIRLTGQNNVCENCNTDSDKIFELSPWSWDVILNPEVDDA